MCGAPVRIAYFLLVILVSEFLRAINGPAALALIFVAFLATLIPAVSYDDLPYL